MLSVVVKKQLRIGKNKSVSVGLIQAHQENFNQGFYNYKQLCKQVMSEGIFLSYVWVFDYVILLSYLYKCHTQQL